MGAGEADVTPLVQKPLQQRCCVPITRHSACLRHGKGNRSSQPLVVRTAGHTTDCALTVNIAICILTLLLQCYNKKNIFRQNHSIDFMTVNLIAMLVTFTHNKKRRKRIFTVGLTNYTFSNVFMFIPYQYTYTLHTCLPTLLTATHRTDDININLSLTFVCDKS